MAGVKITDLTPLATAASDDLLYIVDISDTTESPQGTSKQIEVGNLTASLSVSSGVFTPVISNLINITAVTTYEGNWSRVGESVTFGFYFDFELAVASTSGEFTINLPEIINNFTLVKPNSFIANPSPKSLGTEYMDAAQNNSTQSVTIGCRDYSAGAIGNGNFICIFKR
jgi:hypothetical protein